jgi:hypothetical protein
MTPGVVERLQGLVGVPDRVEPLHAADSLSGTHLERWTVAGEHYIVKHLSADDDWIMRVTNDHAFRPVQVWEAGLLDHLPPCIEHAVVACARDGKRAALLLRDVGAHLVAADGALIPALQHLGFLDHMASLHARFWGWRDTIGLTPMAMRYREFAPAAARCELEAGLVNPMAQSIVEGWEVLGTKAPGTARAIGSLLEDPRPLTAALTCEPLTLVHGDWKLGNLGTLPDGRTILLDWAMPGSAPPAVDLAWYLAVNCDRMPGTKEEAIRAYRTRLEAHGIDTRGWWDRQLDLALLGAFLQLGWSKTGAGGEELGWWEERALAAVPHL